MHDNSLSKSLTKYLQKLNSQNGCRKLDEIKDLDNKYSDKSRGLNPKPSNETANLLCNRIPELVRSSISF